MRNRVRRRSADTRQARPAWRNAPARPGLHSCHRRALKPPFRHVLKDRGPSLRAIYAGFNAAYRRLIDFYREFNPAWNEGRFKLLCSPEESDRRALEDLERIYGDKAVAARETEAQAQTAPRPVLPPPPPAPVFQSYP